MSQVKLTLRPPPNVDFVHGYPGIPPGAPDRPQAAVKGAIEVRVGPQGVKAKWVRIELRKVETLPSGGQANTFYDFVGPSPVNLWTASDEYGVLRTHDFPFSIRIPESIPPTIALEHRAGIKYELVASVCTKGKRIPAKEKVRSCIDSGAIIIDKHELHSTWPVYSQPESRELPQDGVVLIVDRNQTCYGPGDRVSVIATLKSDSLHTVILRGFELTLKETTIFRAGLYTSGKKSAPQTQEVIISESKFPVNATLYGGTQHRAELVCGISPNHTTTTLNAARHIDVTYILRVKALMGTGTHVIMDLPVILSNWQRRIGPTPGLSLLPQHPVNPPVRSPVSATMPQNRSNYPDLGRNISATTYSTLPGNSGLSTSLSTKMDEFGYGGGYGGKQLSHKVSSSQTSTYSASETIMSPITASTTTVGKRPPSARSVGTGGRFAVANGVPAEIPEDGESSPPAKGGRTPWPTAEEEKRKLFESAKAQAEKVQSSVARAVTPPPHVSTRDNAPISSQTQTPVVAPARTSSRNPAWPTAEEEKLRLFQQAQAAALKTQGADSYPSPPLHDSDRVGPFQQAQVAALRQGADLHSSSSMHGRSNSDLSRQASSSRPAQPSPHHYSGTSPGRNGSGSPSSPPASSQPAKRIVPQYLTAEEEKAALRRYEEARLAVDRTQNAGYSSDEGTTQSHHAPAPVAYDSLYPTHAPSGSSQLGNDLPPPFESSSPPSHISEKERVRRAFHNQDMAGLARQNSQSQSHNDTPAYSPPPANSTAGGSSSQLLSEKEILRRKFEASDAEALAYNRNAPPQPPPRTSSQGGRRPAPQPPVSSGSARPLTAAEEKAQLKAQYESKDSQPHVNGNGQNHSNNSTPSLRTTSPTPSATMNSTPAAPPPLMPRPPVEYIRETREEDARVSHYVAKGELPPIDDEPDSPTGVNGVGLPLQPFTPFSNHFEGGSPNIPGPPPPLPPKPAGE
ncbi:hypothetical protein BD779DRAFT_1519397 [Infundibulicybe gibba]|nr:hypothetical protein BD779DRAFT_1519397 [Infundibulicybe gibba]